jgi:hypothetical protein
MWKQNLYSRNAWNSESLSSKLNLIMTDKNFRFYENLSEMSNATLCDKLKPKFECLNRSCSDCGASKLFFLEEELDRSQNARDETAHAKGSQDAAGGFLKNQADYAVLRGKATINLLKKTSSSRNAKMGTTSDEFSDTLNLFLAIITEISNLSVRTERFIR